MIAKPKELITKILELDKDKLYELKEYKYPRNLNQNKKYWKLIYELATKIGIGVEELHFRMLKDYSVRYQICLPHNKEIRGITYYEKKTTLRKEDGNLWDIYYVYVPSHELNTKEFAFLLKGLIEECEEQEIETLSPKERMELNEILEGN